MACRLVQLLEAIVGMNLRPKVIATVEMSYAATIR